MNDMVLKISLALLCAVPIALTIWWKLRLEPKELAATDNRRERHGKQIRELYGEPILSVWTLDLPIMMYEEFMVMDEVKVKYQEVKEVSFNSGGSLYGDGDYQVQVKTTLPEHEYLYAWVGKDPMVAHDLIALIRGCAAEQHFVGPNYLAEDDAIVEG